MLSALGGGGNLPRLVHGGDLDRRLLGGDWISVCKDLMHKHTLLYGKVRIIKAQHNEFGEGHPKLNNR